MNILNEAVEDLRTLLGYILDSIHYCRGIILLFLVAFLFLALLVMIFEGLSFGTALYLTAVTALTIGYGDIVPTTPIGRALSLITGVFGFVFFGFVVAIATHALQQAIGDKRKRELGKVSANEDIKDR